MAAPGGSDASPRRELVGRPGGGARSSGDDRETTRREGVRAVLVSIDKRPDREIGYGRYAIRPSVWPSRKMFSPTIAAATTPAATVVMRRLTSAPMMSRRAVK